MSLFKRCLLIFFWIALMVRPVYSDQLRQCTEQRAVPNEVEAAAEADLYVPLSVPPPESINTGGSSYDLPRNYESMFSP